MASHWWKSVLRKQTCSCCKDEIPADHGWVKSERKSWNVGPLVFTPTIHTNDFDSGEYTGNRLAKMNKVEPEIKTTARPDFFELQHQTAAQGG